MKISLAMIVKNEEEYLDACLKSASDYVDEIIIVDTGSTDKTKKIAAKYGAKIYDFEWCDDFAAARNFSFSKATGDMVLWLDADDILEGGEALRSVCEQCPSHVNVIFVNYDYQVAEDGQVMVKHTRDRIIRNNGATIWKGRLHETPVEVRRGAKASATELNVRHTAKPDRWDKSEVRNLRILQKQLEDEGHDPDPRTVFYLAGCYKSLGDYEQAKELFELYVKMSGWDEERSVAWINLGDIYLAEERDGEAKASYMKAIDERPDLPAAYVAMGQYYAQNEKFERACQWLEMALNKKDPQTSMAISPLEYTYKPWMLYAECQYNMGEFNNAIAAIKQAMKYKNDDLAKMLLDNYTQTLGHKLAAESVTGLAKFLEKQGETEKIPDLLKAVPNELRDNPLVLKLQKAYTEPKVWPKKSVVIFTGSSVLGEWGPWSLSDGIGGSEEAIIRLSRRLKEQGYSVSIFATPGNRAGEYDGITWKNYWELDTRDTFDVFVAWRSPWFFDVNLKARKRYLWLHDVMPAEEFTPERLANLDKVIVLSDYHRSLFPNIPDDKIFLSANGIDADEIEELEKEKIKRDPHLVAYQSSHVRGLAHIYDVWPDVLKAIPDAQLKVAYGWGSYIAVNKDNPERMDWMEKMKRRAEELDGVEDLGKQSQADCLRDLLRAGVWAYPCPFPEISCITAMKAQACGAVPVGSNYAALEETIQWGVKMNMDEWNEKTQKTYTEHLIHMLKDTTYQENIRQQMMPAARKTFSWTNVAKQWIDEFKS
jgi:glycosyltransferase involved in cell wall biosynthesis